MMKFKQLREERRMNMRQMSDALGIPYTTYVSYEKGEREPNMETLSRISGFFQVSMDYLVGNTSQRTPFAGMDTQTVTVPEAELRIQKEQQALYEKYLSLDQFGRKSVDEIIKCESKRCQIQNPDQTEPIETIEIKLCCLPASAGTGDDLAEERYEYYTVPKTEKTMQADYAIRVHGNSMEPTFYDGDILLICSTPYINEGDIGIFVVNGEGYVKEFGEDRLISHNPKYRDIPLHDYDVVICSGLVIGKL